MALLTKDGEVIKREKARILAFDPSELIRPFDERVLQILESAMILSRGNKALAARRLRLNRSTFMAKLATAQARQQKREGQNV